jgi:hypothetical protein
MLTASSLVGSSRILASGNKSATEILKKNSAPKFTSRDERAQLIDCGDVRTETGSSKPGRVRFAAMKSMILPPALA